MYQLELRSSMRDILVKMKLHTTMSALVTAVFFSSLALGQVVQVPDAPNLEESLPPELPDQEKPSNRKLIEEFTSETLPAGDIKIGSDLEFGLTDRIMIGADVVALAIGVSTLQAKYNINTGGKHQFALGIRTAYLRGNTLLWGSVNDHFDELEARVIRPSLSWSHDVSPRLKIHTFWAKGFGTINAKLSEKGKRRLWEAKYPGEDYETRNKETLAPTPAANADKEGESNSDSENQEKESGKRNSVSQQSIQVQSIAGLAQERFQLSGEFSRKNGNRVLVSSRIEQSQFEDLKSKFFRLTAAHHWIWAKFQMRLGVGVQYYVISGDDLDGEKIDEAGVGPASDIVFYWIL
jgi:hypothetical protein